MTEARKIGPSLNEGEQRRVSATFEAADDLLWQAVAGKLPDLPPLTLVRSGFVGPLVELAIGRMATPEAFRGVTIEPPIFHQVEQALANGAITGSQARDRAGVFPLRRFNPFNGNADNLLWDQWAKHVENAAIRAGLPKGLAAGLMGALGELQDNVFEHSGRSDSGLVVYGASNGIFEFVVADAGRGVLASLSENPEFTYLADCGAALRLATSDGASRHATSTGRGYGISHLFRALVHHAAELRFRSGDHALRIWGDSPSLTGQLELLQTAWLDGFTVTVRCALEPARQRS